MELSRRKFLTGLGLGGIAVASPKVFLDVGLAMRQGKANHAKRSEDKYWKVLPKDVHTHLMNPDVMFRDFERTYIAKSPGLWVRDGAIFVDTYVDKANGEIWDVDVATNVAKRRDLTHDTLHYKAQYERMPKELKGRGKLDWIIQEARGPRQLS